MQQKHLYANVDFYSATLYYVMGIPLDLYTPIFVASRVSGWCAHVLEQHADNRLIRPRAEYVGPLNRRWTLFRLFSGGLRASSPLARGNGWVERGTPPIPTS